MQIRLTAGGAPKPSQGREENTSYLVSWAFLGHWDEALPGPVLPAEVQGAGESSEPATAEPC